MSLNNIRQLFQETMEADSRVGVEGLTGRKVLASISGNHSRGIRVTAPGQLVACRDARELKGQDLGRFTCLVFAARARWALVLIG